MREKRPPVVSLLVLPVLGHLCFSYFSLSFIPMSLRRPFVPPRSTRNKSVGNKTRKDKEVESTKSPTTTGEGNLEKGCAQTPISEWRESDEEEDLLPISKVLVADKHKVRGHRKDNSEWGKRMERQLGQIEKRQKNKCRRKHSEYHTIHPWY